MKKKCCFLIALVLAVTLLTSTVGMAADEKVHLVFWDECPGTVQTPAFKGILDEFMRLNPDIEVEYVGIPWDSAKEKYDVAIASKTTPDVASFLNTWLSDFVMKDALLPLEDRFNAWDEASQFSAGLMDAVRGNAPDHQLYAIPYTDNMAIYWARTDLLSEKGLALPTTWDEFFEVINQMTDADNGKYGFTIRGGMGSTGQLLHGIVAYSGMTSYFDENGKCLLNNDKAVEFVERLTSLYGVNTATSDITAGLGETVSAFDSGVAAMMLHNLGSYEDHKAVLSDDQFIGLPYPPAVNGKKTYDGGMWCGYLMFSTTEHPEESWRLIQFLASKYGVSKYNEAIGQLPTRADVLEEPWLENAPHIKAALEYASQPDAVSVSEPTYIPTFASIVSSMIPLFQETLAGSMTAKEFLDTYAANLQSAYDEYMQEKK